MGRYIVRRLLWLLLLVVAGSAIVFAIFYLLPGADPAKLRAGKTPSPEQIEAIREQLGLDRPKLVQWADYMKGVFTEFDLGNSTVNDQPVRDQVLERLPDTLILVAGGAIIWLMVGVLIGIVSAVARGSLWDRLLMGGALVAISAPVYFLGLIMLYMFSDDIGVVKIFPGAGATQNADGLFERLWAYSMPWMVIATAFAAIYARLLRSNLLETLSEDYIRTARAKGLTERDVVLRHGVRSAMTPIVTVFGLDVGILVGGAILTESVFTIDGMGRLILQAINRADLQMIQGATIFIMFGVAIMSLIVDIVYAFLDPRVRYT